MGSRIPGYRIPGYRIVTTPREKLEAYLIGMSHPTVSLSNNNETATISFTPFPNDIAQIIVDTKAVQFGVVRHISAGRSHRKSHSSIQGSRYYSKQSRGDKGFNYQNWNQKFLKCVPEANTSFHKISSNETHPSGDASPNKLGHIALTMPSFCFVLPSYEELISGQMVCDISVLKTLKPGGKKYANMDGSWPSSFKGEFAIGFIYRDLNQWPTIFKMKCIAI